MEIRRRRRVCKGNGSAGFGRNVSETSPAEDIIATCGKRKFGPVDSVWLARAFSLKKCKKKSGVRRGWRHAARSGRGSTRRGVRSRPVRSPCVPRFVIFREHDTLARPRLHPDRRFGAVRRARLHHRDVVMARAPRRMSVSLVTGSGGVGGRPASRHRSRAREGSYGSRFDARTLRTRLGATQTPSAPCASGERVSRFRRRLLMKKIT